MAVPSPDEVIARYDDPIRRSDRLQVGGDRFERVAAAETAWAAAALVLADGAALFVREGEAWLLPGGRLEPGEAPEAGVRREVAEETGIDVEVVDLGAVVERTFVHDGTGATRTLHVATFVAEPLGRTDATPGDGQERGPHHWGHGGRPRPTPADDRIDEAAWRSSAPPNTFDRELVARLLDERL